MPIHWVDFPVEACEVNGLAWFDETRPRIRRFPERFRERIPEEVYNGGKQSAGVRLRLRTDTRSLSIRMQYNAFAARRNMTQFTVQGVSTYVDGRCWTARVAEMNGGQAELSLFEGVAPEMREVCLYLPLYGPAEVQALGFAEGARFESPTPFALPAPVVFYGTSIT